MMGREDEIINRLNKQDETAKQQNDMMNHQNEMLNQIIWMIKGSENLDMEGVMPALKRLKGEVEEIQDEIQKIKGWQEDEAIRKEENNGKLDLKEAAKWIGVMAVGGGLVKIMYEISKDLMLSIDIFK